MCWWRGRWLRRGAKKRRALVVIHGHPTERGNFRGASGVSRRRCGVSEGLLQLAETLWVLLLRGGESCTAWRRRWAGGIAVHKVDAGHQVVEWHAAIRRGRWRARRYSAQQSEHCKT